MVDLFDNAKYIPKNKSIQLLEEDWKRRHSADFDAVKKEWLPEVRDFMREATGLSMHQKRLERKIIKDTNLTFQYVTDRNSEFLRMIDEKFPALDFGELIANRKLSVVMNETEKYYKHENTPYQQFDEVKIYLNKYLYANDIERIIDLLFRKNSNISDIWGTYTYKNVLIEIYYIPLILFSRLMRLDLQFCLLVVLVHEVAHAFHHKGKDSDGVVWDDMNRANINIIEGLAQYYTERFVDLYSSRYPSLRKSYETMLSCQSGPYRIHLDWAKSYKKEHVKNALLAIRRNGQHDYSAFERLLNNARENLK